MQDTATIFYAGHYFDNSPIPLHSHWGAELVYIASGQCMTYFSNGAALQCRSGTLLVTPPELRHRQVNNPGTGCETWYVVLDPGEKGLDTSLRLVDVADQPMIGQWVQNLYELFKLDAREEANALLKTLFLRLKHCERENHTLQNCPEGIKNVIALLENSYMKPLTVELLAEHGNLSKSHLNFLFHRIFGCGVNCYLTRLRMRHARRLLLSPFLNIAEVAHQCGFEDANYFSRSFRKFHGFPPGFYRNHPQQSSNPHDS
ncbi:MAG: AraC family transcriptional regulator [Victivallaceae bacterium]|nr:AraC family transcriptional regulator [Victivallaceae bacterium]